jgi:transcription initiation factor IIF auxiliary subunit
LDLSARWSAHVRTYHVSVVRLLRRQLGVDATVEDVVAWLHNEYERAEHELTMLPSKIVEACWGRWLATDGLAALLDDVRS